MWHGGVHFPVSDADPWVYAAASGTIVAARLNPTNTPTDAEFGSQRFILIRHGIYPFTENDPEGTGQRINYSEPAQRDRNGNPTNPVYIFSLYMIHLSLAPAGAVQVNVPTDANQAKLWVGISTIKVINDEDWFGRGEWELYAKINGTSCEMLKASVSSGEIIRTPATWSREINTQDPQLQAITIEIGGKEIDLIFDDDLGKVITQFGRSDSPAWGVGTHTITSSNGDFEAVINIGTNESVDTRAHGDDIVPESDGSILPGISLNLPGTGALGF